MPSTDDELLPTQEGTQDSVRMFTRRRHTRGIYHTMVNPACLKRELLSVNHTPSCS